MSVPPLLTIVLNLLMNIFSIVRDNIRLSVKCSRLVETLSIIVPNMILLVNCSSTANFYSFALLQNEFVQVQTVLLVGCIFYSTFGSKNSTIVDNAGYSPIDSSAKKLTIASLLAFVGFKFFLFVSSIVIAEPTVKLALCIISGCFLVLGIMIMAFLAYMCGLVFLRQIKGLNADHFCEIHNFFRIIGATFITLYTIGVYINTNRLTLQTVEMDSSSSVEYIIGQAILVAYLNVVENFCIAYEAASKDHQLRTRLDMVRYISHEMRSPLNTSFLGVQILRGTIESVMSSINSIRSRIKSAVGAEEARLLSKVVEEIEEVKETSELVKESSCIALETLNDMLTFDKIDDNKLVLEREELDVWSFVSETARPFRLNAMKEKVTLIIDCVHIETNWFDTCFINADKFKLKQVLRNFVSNAMKFCDKQKGVVQISVEKRQSSSLDLESQLVTQLSTLVSKLNSTEQLASKEVVRVSVTDNGCGISPDNQKKLFGKYVQFNASALQNGQGSGLGLWICKSIAFQFNSL